MKKLIFSLLCVSFPLIAQWVQLAPAPTSYNLTTVCALSSNRVLVAGQSGFIGITTDNGQSWLTKIWATRQDFLDGDFCNENTGLLASEGDILKTIDGGDTWIKVFHIENANIIKVRMFDDLNCVAITNSNYLVRSFNGGETWQISNSATNLSFHAASILSMNSIFLLADTTLVVTSDGGQSFSSSPTQLPPIGFIKFKVIHFSDSLHGIVSYNGGAGIRTTDGGLTWEQVTMPSIYIPFINGVYGLNQRAMIVGEFRYVLKTTDIGTTWGSFTPGPEKTLLDVTAYDETNWFAVGEAGAFQSSSDFGATWHYRQSSTTDKNIMNMVFLDDSTGLIGYGRGLSKTTNGGYDWSVVNSTLPLGYEMYFIDKQHGCFIASDSIFRTTDGGVTFSPRTYSFYGSAAVYAAPNGKVFVGGQSGRLIVSLDSGATWSQLTSHVTTTISTIHFLDSLVGYFVASNVIGKTTDGGETWGVSQFSSPQGLYKFFFFDQFDGIGFRETMAYITRDGGMSWSLAFTAPFTLRDLIQDGEDGAIACGLNGQVFTSQNRGTNWQVNDPVTSVHLRIMGRTPDGTVFIGGDKGTVIKESGESNIFVGIHAEAIETPETFSLSQNYPNPFNPETVIRFAIPETGFVKGVVYDILGREVATLLNGEMNSGSHEVKFEAKGIASGIYFFRLESGKYSSAIKMIVNK